MIMLPPPPVASGIKTATPQSGYWKKRSSCTDRSVARGGRYQRCIEAMNHKQTAALLLSKCSSDRRSYSRSMLERIDCAPGPTAPTLMFKAFAKPPRACALRNESVWEPFHARPAKSCQEPGSLPPGYGACDLVCQRLASFSPVVQWCQAGAVS